jgi:hypothetical protein
MNRRFDQRRGFSTEGLAIMRRRWRELVAEARRDAKACAAGDPLDPAREHALRTALIRTGGAALPVERRGGVDEARNAFVAAGRGLVTATGERREALARLLLAACECVEALLELETRAAAAHWQKQFED